MASLAQSAVSGPTEAEGLSRLFDLEQVGENLFRGESQDLHLNHAYGGQVLGQALAAAGRTVPHGLAHSVHANFLLPGSDQAAIDYRVERVRDGRSFSNRRVAAMQNGRAIFSMSASFHVDEAGTMAHQAAMPVVPAPEELPSLVDVLPRLNGRNRRQEGFIRRLPIEIRFVQPENPYAPGSHPPVASYWLRAPARLPDEPRLHRAVLAYASDYGLLTTASLPHGIPSHQDDFQDASLDHALWFHRDFRADEWLLYSLESPNLCHARGFTQGRIFSRDGRLVASVAQEVLIRERL